MPNSRLHRWAADTWHSLDAMTDPRDRPARRQHPRVARRRRPVRLHLADEHRRLPLVGRSSPASSASSPPPTAARGCVRTLSTLERHGAPRAERHVLQLVRRGHRRGAAHLARQRRPRRPVRLQRRQRLARRRPARRRQRRPRGRPAGRGRCSTRCAGTRSTTPATARTATRRCAPAASCTVASTSSTTTARAASTAAPTSAARTSGYHPPLRHDRLGDPDHELPRHPHRPGPGQALLRRRGAPSRRPATGPGTRCSRSASPAPTSASTSTRARTPTAACTSCPGWGGSMFEELMPAVFVPEETWAPRSWGVNHPLHVRAEREHGLDGGRLRLLGLLAREQPVRRATASTASTRSG